MFLINLPEITKASPKRRRIFAQTLNKFVRLSTGKLASKTTLMSPQLRALRFLLIFNKLLYDDASVKCDFKNRNLSAQN